MDTPLSFPWGNIPGYPGVLGVVQPITTLSRARIASLAVVAGVAALAVPAAANAAVTPALTGNIVTLTGDAAADNIVLSQNAGGLLTHNLGGDATDFSPDPGVQSILAANATVNVNAGAGNDTINLSAAGIAGATIKGEDGDDIIVGSPATDTISGGNGNDRITGFRNTDANPEPISGDAGNDVMIWNNGDGNDLNDGGDGVDESLVTAGTADDDMTVTAPTPGRVLFHRNNAAFSVDMGTVEKLSITSFSGNDKLVTDPGITLPMNIDAGSGDDTITTGDGADVISGGDGNDTLNGAGGGDRIVGDRGNDTANGGAGDDTLVWNNGDGSDVMNGDDGIDRIEDNLSAADDISTLKVEAGRIRYDRLNPGPFNLSIASTEAFELNELGGNDSLVVSAGVGIPVIVDGGAGNDISNVREGSADFVFGGSGIDTAVVDGIDAVAADVESVDRPVISPAPSAGVASLAKTAKVKKGVASVKLSCPLGTSGCKGSVVLVTSKSFKLGKVKAQLALGKASYDLKSGETKTIKVKLASGASRLATKHKLAATARISGTETPAKVTLSF